MHSSNAPSPAWHLLDVLEQLPRDVLQESFWLHLAPLDDAWLGPPDPGLAFRLVCRSTLALADQITHSLRLEQKGNAAPDLALQARHGTFLARQEALQLLLVVDNRWDRHPSAARASAAATDAAGCESHLVTTLQLGGAACHGLQTLQLTSYSGCTAAAGQAVKACCPVLTDLHLRVEMIEPAFLELWRSCPHLTKLSLSSCRSEYDDLLLGAPLAGALAGLHGLRCLNFDAALISDQLHLLRHFTLVRDLRLDWVKVDFDEDRAASAHGLGGALGSLTQLTALQLPGWLQPYVPQGAAVPDDRSQLLGAVLAQLSSLQQLRSLFLIVEAQVLQGGYDTLCGLPLLTQLTCSTISPAVVSVGRTPPRVQRLNIRERFISCAEVAATLRPLLPLTDLRSVNLCVHLCPDAALVGGAAEGADAAVALAAAQLAGQWLGLAPALQHVSIFLFGRCPAPSPAAIQDLFPALLGPMHAQLTSLTMCDVALDTTAVVWPVLRLATRLTALNLQNCKVHGPLLLLLLERHLPGLQHLHVSRRAAVPGGCGRRAPPWAAAPCGVGGQAERGTAHRVRGRSACGCDNCVVGARYLSAGFF